jgi:hypothetical protein
MKVIGDEQAIVRKSVTHRALDFIDTNLLTVRASGRPGPSSLVGPFILFLSIIVLVSFFDIIFVVEVAFLGLGDKSFSILVGSELLHHGPRHS